MSVTMDLVSYGTRAGKVHSGAYLFLPDGEARSLLTGQTRVAMTTGPLVRAHTQPLYVITLQCTLL